MLIPTIDLVTLSDIWSTTIQDRLVYHNASLHKTLCVHKVLQLTKENLELVAQISKLPRGRCFLGSRLRWRGRCHHGSNRLGQKVEHPLHHSLAESEVVSRQNEVAQYDSESSKNDQAQ